VSTTGTTIWVSTAGLRVFGFLTLFALGFLTGSIIVEPAVLFTYLMI